MKNLINSTTITGYCLNHLKYSGYYMHVLEPFSASPSSLITRTEMVVKTLVHLPFSHLMQLLTRESLI